MLPLSMMKCYLLNISKRIICWLLLLQVVNLSVDPVDPISYKIGRISLNAELHFNDIESICELIYEEIMGLDLPEHEEEDLYGFLTLFMLYFTPVCIENLAHPVASALHYYFIEPAVMSVIPDFTSPPPRS